MTHHRPENSSVFGAAGAAVMVVPAVLLRGKQTEESRCASKPGSSQI